MRNKFGKWVHRAVTDQRNIVLLSGDIGYGIFDELISDFPDNFINCGIAEQNMIGTAAGIAQQGLVPIVYTIIPFLIYRPFELVRNLIAHQNQKVILVGVGGGFVYDNLGFTHYAKEDLILASTLPNFNIFTPYDPKTAEKCFERALLAPNPSYVRLMKGGEPELEILSDHDGLDLLANFGDEFSIISHGSICSQGIEALNILKESGMHGSLYGVWDAQLAEKAISLSKGPIFLEEQIFPEFWEKLVSLTAILIGSIISLASKEFR